MKDDNLFVKRFGYATDAGCDICGKKPCQIEPRFGYTTCEHHSVIPPVYFSRVRDGLMTEEEYFNEVRQRSS